MRLLLKHCHLVVDDYKEYLDGAILIHNDTIEDVFVNSNKVDIEDVKTVHLRNQIVMPSASAISGKIKLVDPLMKNAKEIVDQLHNNKEVVLLGNTKAYKKDVQDIEYDGIYRLYENMTGFNQQGSGLVNLAFENKDKYIFLDPSVMSKEVLKFSLENLRNDRVIVLGDQDQNRRVLKEINISLTDILQMTSLNYYRLYQQEKRNGSLLKGKFADIVVLNDKLERLFYFEKGVMKSV